MSILTKEPTNNIPVNNSEKCDVINNVYRTTNYDLFSHF